VSLPPAFLLRGIGRPETVGHAALLSVPLFLDVTLIAGRLIRR